MTSKRLTGRRSAFSEDVQLCTVVGRPFALENPGIRAAVNRLAIYNRELANPERFGQNRRPSFFSRNGQGRNNLGRPLAVNSEAPPAPGIPTIPSAFAVEATPLSLNVRYFDGSIGAVDGQHDLMRAASRRPDAYVRGLGGLFSGGNPGLVGAIFRSPVAFGIPVPYERLVQQFFSEENVAEQAPVPVLVALSRHQADCCACRQTRLEAWGDLTGRGEWTFSKDGEFVDITYDWRIRAEKPLLRLLSPLLKPVLRSNHTWTMRRGEESLKLELVRRRSPRATVSAPPDAFALPGSRLVSAVAGVGALVALLGGVRAARHGERR